MNRIYRYCLFYSVDNSIQYRSCGSNSVSDIQSVDRCIDNVVTLPVKFMLEKLIVCITIGFVYYISHIQYNPV